jgi:hypothetical protein
MNVATMMRRLEEGGFSPGQATALAEVLHDEVVERIATKEDLARLETYVDKHLDRIEGRLVKDDPEQEIRLVMGHEAERSRRLGQEGNRATIKWIGGMMIVQTVAMLTGTFGLIKLLFV